MGQQLSFCKVDVTDNRKSSANRVKVRERSQQTFLTLRFVTPRLATPPLAPPPPASTRPKHSPFKKKNPSQFHTIEPESIVLFSPNNPPCTLVAAE